MKISNMIEFYHPHIGGAQEVFREVSERLVNSAHDVIDIPREFGPGANVDRRTELTFYEKFKLHCCHKH